MTVIICESVNSASATLTVNVSLPLKSVGALKVISLPSTVAVISVPPATLKVKSSPSISLADKLTLPDASSSKLTSDTVASTGASFTPSTVTVNV